MFIIKWLRKTFGKDSVYNPSQKKFIAAVVAVKITVLVGCIIVLWFVSH